MCFKILSFLGRSNLHYEGTDFCWFNDVTVGSLQSVPTCNCFFLTRVALPSATPRRHLLIHEPPSYIDTLPHCVFKIFPPHPSYCAQKESSTTTVYCVSYITFLESSPLKIDVKMLPLALKFFLSSAAQLSREELELSWSIIIVQHFCDLSCSVFFTGKWRISGQHLTPSAMLLKDSSSKIWTRKTCTTYSSKTCLDLFRNPEIPHSEKIREFFAQTAHL
jgi:hypothetical protein